MRDFRILKKISNRLRFLGVFKRKKLSLILFVLIMSATTAIAFHTVAADASADPVGDLGLPAWCPPSTSPGLAVICGTVVTAGLHGVNTIQEPAVPVEGVLVAAYEENPLSPTGKLSGKLTNIFSSTTTNKIGLFRIAVRRVQPPNLKVHLVFFCGSTVVNHLVIDSYHNMWGFSVMVDCKPSMMHQAAEFTNPDAIAEPPFPLDYAAATASFLGCTNNPYQDSAVGLSTHEEPTINTIVSEQNFDHRFTLNNVNIDVNWPILSLLGVGFQFTSPGGLWEPDCLLRNKDGTYQCNSIQCQQWNNGIVQPCTIAGCDLEAHNVSGGYTGVKLYARADCMSTQIGTTNVPGEIPTPVYAGDPNQLLSADPAAAAAAQAAVTACNKQLLDTQNQSAETYQAPPPTDPIDGLLCDTVKTHGEDVSFPMDKADYLTRPFFKFIPKSQAEYEMPFRRFEYRNEIQSYNMDMLAATQWSSAFIGSTSNAGAGFGLSSTRGFLEDLPTAPTVPDCSVLRQRNLPFQEGSGSITRNRLLNSGFITGLAQPFGELENIYYSGQRNLSDYVCKLGTGNYVRLCEIQVPWGAGALCDITDGSCKDPDLKPNLNASLSRLYAPNTMLDQKSADEVASNINETIANCGKKFRLNKTYFAPDLMFKIGNTQTGYPTDTPNDSVPTYSQMVTTWAPADNEQAAGTNIYRIPFQQGGTMGTNSLNTVLCAINAAWCTNNKKEANIYDVLTAPFTDTAALLKQRYLDTTTWKIDSLGPGQAAYCSIANTYRADILGPIEEMAGTAQYMDPARAKNNQDKILGAEGGQFSNLFDGSPKSHHLQYIAGTASWYMSPNALKRDKILKERDDILFGRFNEHLVGTSWKLVDFVFSSVYGRDVWDSVLTFIGGDAKLHDINISLLDITSAIEKSINGDVDWKSYGNRNPTASSVSPTDKPYYTVTFEYPLTEPTILAKFKLPGQILGADGSVIGYHQTDLRPEEWGPGHECYNFDTPVPEGQICGTYREAPEGVSRTCRVDKCVNFNRVETATCRCRRPQVGFDINGNPIYGGNVTCKIPVRTREVRNLIISDCSRDDRLFCAIRQETSAAWEQWPSGYVRCRRYNADGICVDVSPYWKDTRSDPLTPMGDIKPPSDIDQKICNADWPGYGNGCDDNEPSQYKPPLIPDTDCYDKYPDRFTDEYTQSYSFGLTGSPGKDRPRCWVSVAGPFRKYPNFSAAGVQPPTLTLQASGQQFKNCNGYITVTDSALHAAQGSPFELGQGALDPSQVVTQQNLDGADNTANSATTVGVIAQKTLAPPWTPVTTGTVLGTINSTETNNGLYLEGLAQDLYTMQQQTKFGLNGDYATTKSYISPPIVFLANNDEKQLKPLYYNCETAGYSIDPTKQNPLQREQMDVLTTFDPDMDGINGWTCPVVNPPATQIPNIQPKGGNQCPIGSYGNCTKFIKDLWTNAISGSTSLSDIQKTAQLAAVRDFQFSKSFRYILDWAAYNSNTPAAAFLTVMYLEGGMLPQYMSKWGDDATVFNAGIPWWGQMDMGGPATCNNLVWTAQGPYQLIKHWVQVLMDDPIEGPKFCAVMNRAGSGRCDSIMNAGRCNFLDATVLAAFLMNPSAGDGAGQCGGFPIESALALFSGGSYAASGVNMDTAMQLYDACK